MVFGGTVVSFLIFLGLLGFLCLNILYSSVFVSGFLFGRGVGVKIGLCLIWYIFL